MAAPFSANQHVRYGQVPSSILSSPPLLSLSPTIHPSILEVCVFLSQLTVLRGSTYNVFLSHDLESETYIKKCGSFRDAYQDFSRFPADQPADGLTTILKSIMPFGFSTTTVTSVSSLFLISAGHFL